MTGNRLATGVRNLDELFDGGIPRSSLIAISGAPGSGKTILVQQICLHNAAADHRVLYFGTLSEPTAKILRNLTQFSFYDPDKLRAGIEFVDLGEIRKATGIAGASALITKHLRRVNPAIIVIDSFKMFDDLAESRQDLRTSCYDIAVTLMAWEATSFLVGEFAPSEYQTNPLFSIVDGVCVLSQREAFGENQRFLQIVKMRGTNHSREEHSFAISRSGIDVFAPHVLIRREPAAIGTRAERCLTRISKLDELIGTGIPWGSSLLLSGVAGTGKTVLSLEFLYRGALAGEKGIFFSFEETEDRLRAAALGLGWDLDSEIERGMIEIVFIPQPEIRIEADLLMVRDRIARLGARRVVIDSVSVFLHKLADPELCREKIFHLCSIVQNAQAVGLFATDIPYGATQISRFGVEETVVDGVILLRSLEEGLERQRYIEVYKLRDSAHLKGLHSMAIGPGGVAIFPRYNIDSPGPVPPRPLDIARRMESGVPGLDRIIGGGLLARSITLVSGSSGIGKTTMAMQFLVAGAERGEAGLYVTLEEGTEQLLASAAALGLPLRDAIDRGLVDILFVSRETIRIGQFLTVLADKLTARKATRLVIDAITHMMNDQLGLHELRHVLYQLGVRFKALDVTSLFTLEASSLYSTELVTEHSLSPIADNLLMLRYRETAGRLRSVLTVVKTRGSEHDHGTHDFSIGTGGARIEPDEAAH
ncbi:MAG TPA: ATPase domain-containing protein [Kofleriaceae bacterium]